MSPDKRAARIPGAVRLPARRAALAAATLLVTAAAIVAGHAEVDQIGRAFTIASIQIHAGDTIDFMNKDDFDHQIYVDSPAFTFESDESAPGEKVGLRIPVTGTFEVRCHIHPKMHLTVTVN